MKFDSTPFLETATLLAAASARESAASTVSNNPFDSIDDGLSPSTSALRDCVALLERSQQNLVHLGRMADIQSLRHGLPQSHSPKGTTSSTSKSPTTALEPRNELLHTFALALSAYHMTPPGTRPPSDYFLPPLAMPASTSSTLAASSQAYKSSGQLQTSPLTDVVKEETRSTSSKKSKFSHSEDNVDEVDYSRFPKTIVKDRIERLDSGSILPLSRTDGAITESIGLQEEDTEISEPLPSSTPSIMSTLADAGPAKSRSKWAPAEIALFEEGIRLHGEHNPKLISEHMRGCRSNEQVRERIKSIKRSLGLQKKYVPPASKKS
jgi:hypothetical protein